MKFKRNVTIFTGRLDAAPWASFLVLIATMLTLKTIFFRPTGVQLTVPTSQAGTVPPDTSTLRELVLDASGRIHFDNQIIGSDQLADRLRAETEDEAQPMTLALQLDKDSSLETILRIHETALDAGFHAVMIVTSPR